MEITWEIEDVPFEVMPCSICGTCGSRIRTTISTTETTIRKHHERMPCVTCEQLWPYFESRLQAEDYSATY